MILLKVQETVFRSPAKRDRIIIANLLFSMFANIALWVILQNNAEWDCFKTPILREILEIPNPLLEEHCAFLEVIHLFQKVGRARNKLLFSHSSTESEIISLDTGLRLDGLPALELWDLIVSVFGSVSQISDRTGQPVNDVKKHHKSQKILQQLSHISSLEYHSLILRCFKQ